MTRCVGGYRQCVSVSCMHCVAYLVLEAVLASLLPPHRLKYCSVCTAMECDACAVIIPVSLRLTLQCIESNGSPRVLQVCTCQSSYAVNSTILPRAQHADVRCQSVDRTSDGFNQCSSIQLRSACCKLNEFNTHSLVTGTSTACLTIVLQLHLTL